jgi:electron transport complex protein RnfG
VNEAPLEPADGRAAPAWRAVASLALFGALAALTIGAADQLTRPRIAANETAALLAQLHELVPADRHDNDLATDTVQLPIDGPAAPTRTVYRARRGGLPVAAILTTEAPDGYSGPIRLLVAIDAAGTVLAVRVASHRETPGIGDFIDVARSRWIDVFRNRSLAVPGPERWQLRSDGGDFDAVAGATVTSRAMVGGVRRALEFHASRGEALWTP